MKVFGKIVQWFFVAFFLILVIYTGVHISSFFFLQAAVLMAPITPLRNLLKKIKIKTWLAILISVGMVLTGIMLTPVDTGSPYDYIKEPSYTDSDYSQVEDKYLPTSTKIESSTIATETAKPTTEEPTTTIPETTVVKTEPNVVGIGEAEQADPSELPSYSGNPYTVLNNNIPNFTSAELTTKGYEKYSNLDSYGRCGVALASCGKEIMPGPDEERGSISSIKPSGWVQAKYDGVSGGYLWNRCHLIGWQLSAENANKQNLITGTRYMNTEGMLPFENMVADYIKETNNHVAYRVTPIYEGSNLVCSGVQIEAYSIEDKGDGICFNVYCYNVQPGITIYYSTGESSGPPVEEKTEPPVVEDTPDDNAQSGNSTMVWIPQSGSKYHSRADCSNMNNPSQVTKEEAESMGYEPCKRCH